MGAPGRVSMEAAVPYRIAVKGRVSEHSSLLHSIPLAIVGHCGEVTALAGTVDQAELHGALRSLYYVGLPLISVAYDGAHEADGRE